MGFLFCAVFTRRGRHPLISAPQPLRGPGVVWGAQKTLSRAALGLRPGHCEVSFVTSSQDAWATSLALLPPGLLRTLSSLGFSVLQGPRAPSIRTRLSATQ